MYDSVDEKIIPQKSFLNELNTIIPSNRYFNLYYTTSSSNEMIFYYFDNNQNRITITNTFNASFGKTNAGQIIVKLFSFNVYLRRIVNTCPFNGILATNNSFCASNNDKLGLQQYYVIKFKNRDNENFEQFENRPIRFFQNTNNNIITTAYMESGEIGWYNWETNIFEEPLEDIFGVYNTKIYQNDDEISSLNKLNQYLSMKKPDEISNEILIKFGYKDNTIEALISFHGKNVLGVISDTDPYLFMSSSFLGNYLKTIPNNLTCIPQISLQDQLIMIPVANSIQNSDTSQIIQEYIYIDRNTGLNMFTAIDIGNIPAVQSSYPHIYNNIIIVPTSVTGNREIAKYVIEDSEVIFFSNTAISSNEIPAYASQVTGTVRFSSKEASNTKEYMTNDQSVIVNESSDPKTSLYSNILENYNTLFSTSSASLYSFTRKTQLKYLEPSSVVFDDVFITNLKPAIATSTDNLITVLTTPKNSLSNINKAEAALNYKINNPSKAPNSSPSELLSLSLIHI